jgi:hypothetical protein
MNSLLLQEMSIVYVVFKLKVHHFNQLGAAAKKMEFDRLRARQIDNIADTSLISHSLQSPSFSIKAGVLQTVYCRIKVYEYPRDTSSTL